MNQTEHYGMDLPAQTDFYDVDVFNDNTRLIDGALHALRSKELVLTILGSGTFRPADRGLLGAMVDVYMVAGGAGGSASGNAPGGGGGGGRGMLLRNVHLTELTYPIVIGAGGVGRATGANGGGTNAFGQLVAGGAGGATNAGGNGGSGGGSTQGDGGSFGSDGGGPNNGGMGEGNDVFSPWNPYDGIAYGCGGGGALGRGGGAGGRGGTLSRDATGLGGGGGGGQTTVRGGGQGGLGGGGGGAGAYSPPTVTGGRGGHGLVYIYARPKTAPATAPLMAAALEEQAPIMFTGDLSPAEILACDAKTKEYCFDVGVIKDGVCIDTGIFSDMADVEAFLALGVWPGADAVAALPEDCGIGDMFDGQGWVKQTGESAEAL